VGGEWLPQGYTLTHSRDRAHCKIYNPALGDLDFLGACDAFHGFACALGRWLLVMQKAFSHGGSVWRAVCAVHELVRPCTQNHCGGFKSFVTVPARAPGARASLGVLGVARRLTQGLSYGWRNL
jgi:hypothetical protein